MALVAGNPNLIQVMTEVFRHIDPAPGVPDDNVEWVLFKNGTFYTFPKGPKAAKGQAVNGDDLVGQALEMSKNAHLLNYKDNDCVTIIDYPEFGHPTYVVLSCLHKKIGWIIIAKDNVWAKTEQQQAAVGYLARTLYEMDCEESHVLATSFPWSAQE